MRKVRKLAQLFGALLRQILHVVLSNRNAGSPSAGLDTSRLQALAHSVGAQCALDNALGLLVQFRNIEWAARNAVAAANALILLKIHDAVGVLDDRAVCGHAARQPGSVQCMHWFFRISHISEPSSFSCSLKRIKFQ
jgi:hypothetical protein